MKSEFKYVGSELELFAAVHNWKAYWASRVKPFIAGDVLEVGAGIGANTPLLDSGNHASWVCLEPDADLLDQLKTKVGAGYEIVCGTVERMAAAHRRFDTILYIDVLEHIENDREELALAASCLNPGGRIVVLSPAHQFLFSPFDAAIGHFRRYNRAMLRRIGPPELTIEMMIYLDSVGIAASAANALLLRRSMPNASQLRFWDHYLVPVSRITDKLLLNSVGKTVIAVWRKPL